MNKTKTIVFFVLFCFAAPLFLNAHFTWIVPAEKEKCILIGHGHSFPQSEHALALEGLQVILLDSRGKSHSAQPEKREKEVAAKLPADLEELAAAIFQQEAVIITRTTSGVKRGAMNTHSGVIDSFRRLRSAYFQSAPGVELPVIADRLLLQAENRDGKMYFSLRLGPQSLAGIPVKMVASGQDEGREIGKTDSTGRIFFKPEKAGLYLFSADYSPEVKHDEYLREQYAATLAVLIE